MGVHHTKYNSTGAVLIISYFYTFKVLKHHLFHNSNWLGILTHTCTMRHSNDTGTGYKKYVHVFEDDIKTIRVVVVSGEEEAVKIYCGNSYSKLDYRKTQTITLKFGYQH